MIKCPNCTAQLAFNATDKRIKCDYCGSSFSPEELKATLTVAGEKVTKETKEVKVENKKIYEEIDATSYCCDNCGASLLVYDDTAVTFCNYCGSSNMIKSKMIKQTKPDYIIPFEFDKEKCIEIYKKKLKRSLFAPKYMSGDITVSNFRGIYMPYEIYNYVSDGRTVNTGEVFWKRNGDYDYYHIYTITADLDGYIKGLSYDGVSRFYDSYSASISPYDYTRIKDFNLSYVSGFYADSFDVQRDLYGEKALETANKVATNVLKKDKRFERFGCSKPTADLINTDRKVGMFPVYFLGIRDKKNENISYAVVNGQTGKVAMDIPIDFKKYLLFSLLIAGIMFAFLQSVVFLPKTVLIISIFFSIVSFVISICQLTSINKELRHISDLGISSKIKNKEDKKKSGIGLSEMLIKYLCKPIIAFVIAILVLVLHPINDAYYYGAVLISSILTLICFYDIVAEHNKLSCRKIPQLEKRGGDN